MIDPEIAAFIADTEAFYPADASSRSTAEQRRLYDAYAAAFAPARPSGLAIDDANVLVSGRAVAVRRYRRARQQPVGTVIYAHGGGFMLGSLDSHDGLVARIADRTGADVISVGYRLAPEHPAPAALDDVVGVIEAVGQGGSPWPDLAQGPIVLAGDSAGATLVASAALRLQDRVRISALALVYPMLGFEPAPPARDSESQAPMLTLADVHFYRDLYLAGRKPDPGTFALDAPSLADFPPTFLLAAEHDPLRDDCTAFAERLREAGTPVALTLAEGLVHGFLRAIDRSRAAAAAFDALVAFLRLRLAREGDALQSTGAGRTA
ncbi:MAG: alpha/beta hydrolase [Methylobacteriaceae bacterium]|nr:alpha/beta hydrolase [Methylobacteriaceae bacterium]